MNKTMEVDFAVEKTHHEYTKKESEKRLTDINEITGTLKLTALLIFVGFVCFIAGMLIMRVL